MLKPNISPKSPQIERSNDTFAELKCCQVFAYKSETFTVGDPMKMGNKNPQNLPFPCTTWTPIYTQKCLGPPHAPRQTAAPTVEALSHTDAVNSTLVTMARSKFAPQSIPSVDRSPNPATCLISGPVRPMMPKASGSDPPFLPERDYVTFGYLLS